MTDVRHLEDLVAAVMPDVILDVTGCTSILTTEGVVEHASPPRVVWVPARDKWLPPQKRPRGGGSSGKSVATRMAGVILHMWAGTITATELLIAAVVRALRRHIGPEDFLNIEGGQWVSAGATTLGQGYQLTISVAIDVTGRAPAASDTPTTATPTIVTTDPTGAVTGDGYVDTGETT